MTRILLVDSDDAEAAELARSMRARRGWDVVRAGSLLEAIRAAGESPFDAAVLDAELRDGSGLDILDFLRLGSPGIRIVLLSSAPSEAVALHALSHGAGDVLPKDRHLELELAERVRALLAQPTPERALVETLAPRVVYDAHGAATGEQPASADGVEDALAKLVSGSVLAAGVWDLQGRPVCVQARELDADGVGFALAMLHGQVGALWTYGSLKPVGYRMIVQLDGALLAATAIPGTYLVALLFESGASPRGALERMDEAALRLLAALQEGSSGDDVPTA